MKFHREVLPPDQQQVLRQLGPAVTACGFCLGGGTAIAIQLGHRQSVDLDWFTSQRLDDPMGLSRQLQSQGIELRVRAVQRRTLHGEVAGVRVSFLEFGYPLLEPAVAWLDFDCCLASLTDLAAMKLLAVSQRGAKKDFLDIYALGTHGLSLGEMLDLYRRKFSVTDVVRVLGSLCYFDDADPEPMPKMLTDSTWQQAKKTIRNWVKTVANAV